MTNEVTRYRLTWCERIDPHEDGEWVKYEDYERLAAELRRANSALVRHGVQEMAVEPPHEPSDEPVDFKHLYECEKASKMVMQGELDSLKSDLHAMANSAETLEALKTAHQALLEVRHAQEVGPGWYTRGESGLFQQTSMWIRRGLDALNKTRPIWQPENRGAEP